MNMLKKIVVLTFIAILSGCAASNIKPDVSVQQLIKKNKAVMVFSIAQPLGSEKYGDSVIRLIRSGNTLPTIAKSHDIMNILVANPPSEFSDRYGRIASIELEPGEYQVEWMFNDGQGLFSLRGPTAPNVVRVEAGEVVYVGELLIALQFGEGIFNLKRVVGAAGILNDESARDIPMFEKKFPKLGKPIIRLFRTGPITTDTSNVLEAVK